MIEYTWRDDQPELCPFCSGKPRVMTNGRNYYVMCKECHANSRLCESHEQAVEAWNHRPNQASQLQTPEGWQIVPKEPTQDMLPNAWRTVRHCGGQGVDHDCLRAIYRDMLAAAPKPNSN